MKTESKCKILEEAGEAILHVVKAFNFFREENYLLNTFLHEIESLISTRCGRERGKEIQENVSLNSNNTNPDSVSCPSYSLMSFCINGTENEEHSESEAGAGIVARTNELNSVEQQNVNNDKIIKVKIVNAGPGTEEESTPEEQVFDIDFLLEYILSQLNTSDLKTTRCVSPTWNVTATKLLLRRTALVPDNVANPSVQNFLSFFGWQVKHMRIKLHKNYKYKYYNSHNHHIENDNDPDNDPDNDNEMGANNIVSVNIDNVGPSVLNLSSNNSNCDQFNAMKVFKDLLTEQVPNLEGLVLGNVPPLWELEDDMSQLFPEPLEEIDASAGAGTDNVALRRLKSIHFLSPPPFKIIDDLVRTARNLDSIALSPGCDSLVSYLIEANKVSLLKELEIELDDDNTELYDTFSELEFKLNLTKFVISIPLEDPEEWLDVVRIILNILKSSADTLEEFHSQPHSDLFGFEFPFLPKLKRIRILNSIMVYGKFFTDDLKLSEIFPQLESIESEVDYDVKMYLNYEWDWDTIFGASANDVHTCVRNLDFMCGPPAKWIENFGGMFPNLTRIKIGLLDDFPRASQVLWKLVKLEELEFGIEIKDKEKDKDHVQTATVGEDVNKNAYPGMDVGFTGFSEEMCLQLYETSRDVTWATLESSREWPSILEAKCLRRLHMKFHDEFLGERDGDTLKILSHVTGLFAFRMCSDLQVTITLSAVELANLKIMKNSVSAILPYIESVTLVDECCG